MESEDSLLIIDGMAEEGQLRPFGFQRPQEQEDLLTEILLDKYKDLDEGADTKIGSRKTNRRATISPESIEPVGNRTRRSFPSVSNR